MVLGVAVQPLRRLLHEISHLRVHREILVQITVLQAGRLRVHRP